MLTILLAPCVTVVGALMYGFSGNAKVAEIGRILFFVGAFFTVSMLAQERLRL
jgi:Na+/phosphate symporter